VKFINDRIGWVAGGYGIARTEDGGKTWQISKFEFQYFIGIVSDGKNKVWAIEEDGTNYGSSDQGRTWKKCRPRNIC